MTAIENQKPVSFKLIKAVLTNPHIPDLFDGTETHTPALGTVNSLLLYTQDEDLIESLVEAALPEDYSGDTLREVPEMIRSGIKKGLHLRSAGGAGADPKISDRCLEIINAQEPTLFHDQKGEGYITIPAEDGGSLNYPVRSKSTNNWVRYGYYKNTGKALAKQSLAEVVEMLEARALFEGCEEKTHLRMGGLKERVFIDLGRSDGKVVKITKNGWSIESECPIKFYRSTGFQELPLPIRGGDLQGFPKLLNLSHRNWILALAFILNALNPNGPYFWLLVSAEQDAGKTFLCKTVRRIIDPMMANILRLPKTERDLMVMAEANAVLMFDNASGIKWDMSDALCALSTGTGYATRKLFTDADVQLFSLKRPYMINGIGEFAYRPDHLDRAIPIHLPSMDPVRRKKEEEINAEFEEMLPGLLGCLYDIVAHALEFRDRVETPVGIRMADAAQWLAAAEGACDFPEGTFAETIREVQHDLFVDTVINDPLAIALRDLVNTLGEPFENTVGNLFSSLALDEIYGRQLPKTPSYLSKALTRMKPSLMKAGIFVEFLGKSHKGQIVKVWVDPTDYDTKSPKF
ncbi:MAG: hypothetical protein GY927_20300 [bacterium]|nr:hypothetical protein [bacterium]